MVRKSASDAPGLPHSGHSGGGGGRSESSLVLRRSTKGMSATVPAKRSGAMVARAPMSMPLAPPEWPEWGNPGASEADFRTILSYSPYDNVKPQRYPPILALGGLTDPRVTYWEPAKWVAR